MLAFWLEIRVHLSHTNRNILDRSWTGRVSQTCAHRLVSGWRLFLQSILQVASEFPATLQTQGLARTLALDYRSSSSWKVGRGGALWYILVGTKTFFRLRCKLGFCAQKPSGGNMPHPYHKQVSWTQQTHSKQEMENSNAEMVDFSGTKIVQYELLKLRSNFSSSP